MNTPIYWKTTLSEIDDIIKCVHKAKVSTYKSAGGRNIYLLEYGRKNRFDRKANYSSASGARDLSCYADKKGKDIRPCVFLVGGIHGAECEGIMAVLNLISLLETGRDLKGEENPILAAAYDDVNFVIIPCANPDGRARFPMKSAVGMTLPDFRYYAQGTWKDGTLCNWPDCKKVHPILEAADFLGAYYNDDGINLMHDNFTFPMAEETKILLSAADEYVPDITILLHGCANARSEVLMPRAVHPHFKRIAYEFAQTMANRCKRENIGLTLSEPLFGDDDPLHGVNLVSAITNTCGELCMTYESNQGLTESANALTHDEIYRQHILLLENTLEFVTASGRKE